MDQMRAFAFLGPPALCALQAYFSYLAVKAELEAGKSLSQTLKTVKFVYLMFNALGWLFLLPAMALVSFEADGMGGPEAATGFVAAILLGAPAGFVVGLVMGGFALLGSVSTVLPETPERPAKEHALAVSKGIFFFSLLALGLLVALAAFWRTFLSPQA